MSHVAKIQCTIQYNTINKIRVKYHLNDYYFQCCIILFDVILNVNKLLFTVGRWHKKKKFSRAKGWKRVISGCRSRVVRSSEQIDLSLSLFFFFHLPRMNESLDRFSIRSLESRRRMWIDPIRANEPIYETIFLLPLSFRLLSTVSTFFFLLIQ